MGGAAHALQAPAAALERQLAIASITRTFGAPKAKRSATTSSSFAAVHALGLHPRALKPLAASHCS